MHYNLTLITPPAVEPLSLADVQNYLRIDTTNDTLEDAYVTSLIVSAREYCENFQNRAYITQTWEMALPRFPFSAEAMAIEIPKGKLQTIESITYKDTAGVENTLVPELEYAVSNRGILGRISPPFGKVFPLDILYPLDPVVIRFTCGYGDGPEDVPARVKQAMMLLIAHWYENRVVVNDLRGVNPVELTFTVSSLLSQNRIALV
ncbi:head-tail connector protein [Desulfosporosinus sp. Sb-LF]|uniref:head-tail connector protein n=1 Tax=Desulfosporosinus sp. Sb-LF TaxID=2560027 RepID=UPI00107F8017|nr:head-tail connector protein [Desulfosporosinus sp. Sb-LF]TGE33329.1 hypothetical protein E4K68_07495 [Desulfosporosinus sp. Sb-LF]